MNELQDIGVLHMKHILVVSVLSVNASPWQPLAPPRSEFRMLSVGARIGKVLRGNVSSSAGDAVTLEVKQIRYRGGAVWDNPEFWSYRDLHAGQTFLIYSQYQGNDLEGIFRNPVSVASVEGSPDAGDVEFILAGSAAEAGVQAERLAAWLKSEDRRHGAEVGRYAASLLSHTSRTESPALWDLAAGGLSARLSEQGEHDLIATLCLSERSSEQPRNEILKILARHTLYALGEHPGEVTKIQLDIVQNYLPALLAMPAATDILKSNLFTGSERSRAQAALQDLSASPKFSAGDKQTLEKLRLSLSQK